MPAFRFIVCLWLLAAPSARAQRVGSLPTAMGRGASSPYGSVLVLPRLSPPPTLAAPSLLAPALSAPAAPVLAAPALLGLPAPVPLMPAAAAPLKLAAIDAAVAQFAAIDLKSAPAADIKGGADALMARALGADTLSADYGSAAADWSASAAGRPLAAFAPAPARAPAAGPGVHLLSKPLHATVELGPTARFIYYALEAGGAILKAALTWHATGSPAAAAAVLAFDLIKAPGWLTAESLADLNLRYWRRKLTTLKRLADMPGVTRIRVLTTGQAEFSGMLARRKENTGLVFVDSSGSLPAEIPGFGAPIALSGLEGRQARLTLVHNGVAAKIDWTPTLAELLSGAPIPADVAAAWRAKLEAGKKARSPLRRLFDFKKDKDLRVEARLSDGKGGESPLGTIVFGGAVKNLVGLGRWDRVGALFGRRPPARAIPISDTTVERGGKRLAEGALRRAWRRLTGALIVRD